MIGHDIVDLKQARQESNWRRRGFLDKLFTDNEQMMILKSDHPEQKVWELWSRKEAAYKIYNRQTKIRAFIAKQLECADIAGFAYGIVTLGQNIYFTKTTIIGEKIESIAVLDLKDFEKIAVVSDRFIAKDSDGIPFHKFNKNPISISHHGRFEKKIQLERNA